MSKLSVIGRYDGNPQLGHTPKDLVRGRDVEPLANAQENSYDVEGYRALLSPDARKSLEEHETNGR